MYRHFEDKDDLLAAVALDCQERLGAEIEKGLASAPADPLEQFRATGIALVRFAAAYPEHYRVMSLPGLSEGTQATKTKGGQQRDALAAAIAKGEIADLPLDDILLAAGAIVSGLAQMIIEGQLGHVSPERAEKLAIVVTGVLGVGLIPRGEDVHDPFTHQDVKATRKKKS